MRLPGGGGTPQRVSLILQGHTLASSIPLDGAGAEPGLFLVQGPCEVFGISATTGRPTPDTDHHQNHHHHTPGLERKYKHQPFRFRV